ncbi:hypothetical protein HYX17_03895 [Candidatus Woesearchaeota archaeon]|nr:hypothetical protein [Candidatus Woesearchaeota archaeon]
MKEDSWDDCLSSNSSIRVTIDKEKAKSLIETSEERVEVLSIELNEKTANYIFEYYYSSVLELLHALVLLNGYKVNNHICLGYYLRDVLKKDDIFRLFDDLRFKRNSLVYYGKRMDFDIANDAIEKSKKLSKELKAILDIKLKE